VSQADVVIYTTGICGFCHAAKRLLDQKDVEYREVRTEGRSDLRGWLVEASGQRTVPQIFINGEPIGGFSELSGLEGAGTLDDKLSAAPLVDRSPLPS